MKFVGYAVRLCADGNIRLAMVEKERSVDSEEAVPDSALAEALDISPENIFQRIAVNLPIKGEYKLVYAFFGDCQGMGENELAEKLCANGTEIYGDVLLLPSIKKNDGEFSLISMPLEVADTVSLVCRACRYAIENGCEDTILGVLI